MNIEARAEQHLNAFINMHLRLSMPHWVCHTMGCQVTHWCRVTHCHKCRMCHRRPIGPHTIELRYIHARTHTHRRKHAANVYTYTSTQVYSYSHRHVYTRMHAYKSIHRHTETQFQRKHYEGNLSQEQTLGGSIHKNYEQ